MTDLSTRSSTSLSPKPSISIALREAKCLIASFICAPQNKPPEHRATASPSARWTDDWQTGQRIGNSINLASKGLFSTTTFAICGITSPARRMITISPIRRPKRSISSRLWSVALLTVTPPTKTGSSLATGVIAPVLPTWNSTSKSRVISSCAGNFRAIAQRGALATKPSLFWSLRLLTL